MKKKSNERNKIRILLAQSNIPKVGQPQMKVPAKTFVLDEFTIIEDRNISNDEEEEEVHNTDLEDVKEPEQEQEQDHNESIERNREVEENEVNTDNNLQKIIKIVEIYGKKNKQIRKQCRDCKFHHFTQGEIFMFINMESLLAYLKYYVDTNKNLLQIAENKDNPNYSNLIKNKEKLEEFIEIYNLN